MKKISLKSMLLPVNNPTYRNLSTLAGNLLPQSNLAPIPNCPEAPYLFIKLKSLIEVVFPKQFFKAFPGSFLQRWLLIWYYKIIDDYNEISIAVNSRINSYKNAYFEWMENFMELEYHDAFPAVANSRAGTTQYPCQRITNSHSDLISNHSKSKIKMFDAEQNFKTSIPGFFAKTQNLFTVRNSFAFKWPGYGITVHPGPYLQVLKTMILWPTGRTILQPFSVGRKDFSNANRDFG